MNDIWDERISTGFRPKIPTKPFPSSIPNPASVPRGREGIGYTRGGWGGMQTADSDVILIHLHKLPSFVGSNVGPVCRAAVELLHILSRPG